MSTFPDTPRRHTRLRNVVLSTTFALLAACGGGGGLNDLFSSLWIYSVESPSRVDTDADVSVIARAGSTGDISSDDMEWTWDQTGGDAIRNQTVERGSNSSILRFKAPSSSGTLTLKVTLRAKGLADSESLNITVSN
ncbi:hypothetical protein GCM10027046_25130 [Uliginosibacterium flavum]|uniref:PKD domain-containing protein n=1 Tax=Uliginosibacterium flavum TaxID=1396831 RepID=A0ABV2TKK3_9RHOO